MNRSNRSKIDLRTGINIAAVVAFAIVIASSLWWIPRQPHPPQLKQATRLPEPLLLPSFQLVDQHGAEFTRASLRKHWSLLFFGYTHCPDVCPTTMFTLQKTARQLHNTQLFGGAVQFVLVSVDPERDTPEHLARFVSYFNKDFIGITGAPQAIDDLTRQLGIMYARPEAPSSDNYLVDHSASILLVDPQARFYAVFSPPHLAGNLASDLKKLSNYYAQTL
ncbi:MAG: SCO family protein [Gammaproteobacteria bacterium]